MSKKKSLFLSLSLVLIAGLSIVAGTFAYFQWQAATGTQVNVTIEMGGITMNIEPEETEFVGLYPTAHCINNVRYGDALVTIENKTGALAIPSFKLKVAVNPSVPDTGKLNDYKDNIHYAVVALETNKDGSKKLSNGNVVTVGGNTIDELVTGTCSVPLNVSNTGDNDNTFKTDYGKTATGLFDVITAEKTFADTAFLPREYNSTTGKVQGVTFRGEAYSTSYQWYRVYVWIDENYTTTIVGNTVSDPLQNAQISVTWSENSMLQQVSGVSNVEEELAPGAYDLDGTFTSWEELLSTEKITVTGTEITSMYSEINTNVLVIPDEITKIGDLAFALEWEQLYGSTINEVRFGKNSKLEVIGYRAFEFSSLSKIEIPASVTLIAELAFNECNLGNNLTFAPNSQLTTLVDDAFIWSGLTSIEIPASVETIGRSVFFGCNLGDKLTFAPGSRLTSIDYNAFGGAGITDIVIPNGLVTITSMSFGSNPLENITIPLSVNEIQGEAFSADHILSFNIIYEGTIEQWNSINKHSNWNVMQLDTGFFHNITVICIDGTINVNS